MNLNMLCDELNNWFDYDRQFGVFTISEGTMDIPRAQDGQYVRIVGSVFNDGVYQYPLSGLVNETFDGAVWLMAVPPEAVSLTAEISEWITANADALNSPYQSESFGGYSYSKASGAKGSGLSWQDHFATQLSSWRKICPY